MNYITVFTPIIAFFTIVGCQKVKNPGSKNSDGFQEDKVYQISYNSGDVVTEGFLDKSGLLWFATTQEGVFAFNGKTFTNYKVEDGLCGNEVWSIMQDTEGAIWFGTGKGMCKFSNNTFITVTIPETPISTQWLNSVYPTVNPNGVASMVEDSKGNFWIGSNGAGAYYYNGFEFTPYLQDHGKLMPDGLHHNTVLSIIKDDKANMWFSSFSHGGMSKYDGNSITHYPLPDEYGDGMISDVYQDSKGTIWVGTRNGGIHTLNGDKFVNIKDGDQPNDIAMATFLEDSNGTMWLASYARKGIYQYDGTTFLPFDITNSDQLVDMKSMVEDMDGNIWFGGRHGILWRYDGKELVDFTFIKRSSSLDN